MFAVTSQPLEVITRLVEAGARVNAFNKKGSTPLIEAARFSTPDVVDFLVSHKANVEAMNKSGHKALHYALKNPRLSGAFVTLRSLGYVPDIPEFSPEVQVTRPEKTAPDPESLMTICREKNLLDVEESVMLGAKVNIEHLRAASEHNSAAVINFLIEELKAQGIKPDTPDSDGNTPLMIALTHVNSREGAIKALLVHTSSKYINQKNNDGNTALTLALTNNLYDEAILLAKSKASLKEANAKEILRRKFLTLCKSGSPEAIKLAIDSGVSVNLHNSSENTGLIYAACYNSPEAVNLLLDSGADASIRNSSGARALDYARNNAKLKASEALRRLTELTQN